MIKPLPPIPQTPDADTAPPASSVRPYQKRKLIAQKIGPADKRRRARGLTRAIRTAIDAMIFDRCNRAEACKRAGITERALYLAFEKMEVSAYWKAQTDVLRKGERASNLFALIDIRDQKDNRAAAVKAVQVLEQLEIEAAARPPTEQRAGFVILIAGPATPPPNSRPLIDVTPGPIAQEPEPPALVYPHEGDEAGEVIAPPDTTPVRSMIPSRRLAPADMKGIDELAASRAPRQPRRRGRLVE
jgi:hypothetical protein